MNKAYLLKIRGGVEVDSQGKKAGKGPLIAEEISNTLGTSQDQYLFQPVGVDCYNLALTGDKGRCLATASGGLNEHIPVVLQPAAYGVVTKGNGDAFISKEKHTSLSTGGGQAGQGYPCVLLDDQGGSVMRVSDGDVSPTLRAKMNGHPPIIFKPMGFDCYNQSVTGDVTTTLRAGMYNCSADTVPTVVMATQRPNAEIMVNKCPTITASAGLGGTWKPVVAYGISSYESNAMKSSNPHAGIYETNTARTIDVNGGNPACNQGGVVIVYSVDEKMGQTYVHEDMANTLAQRDYKQPQTVVYPKKTVGSLMASGYNKLGTQEAMNDMFVVCEKGVPKTISMEVFHCDSAEERTAALKARDYKDPQIIALDRAALNQGKNAKYDISVDGGGTAQTLIASGPGAVCYRKPLCNGLQVGATATSDGGKINRGKTRE